MRCARRVTYPNQTQNPKRRARHERRARHARQLKVYFESQHNPKDGTQKRDEWLKQPAIEAAVRTRMTAPVITDVTAYKSLSAGRVLLSHTK